MQWKVQDNELDRKALADTTPLNNKNVSWWKDKGLRTLNLGLFWLLFSEFTQGYDASLINNVQQLKRWQSDFHYPEGSTLGLLSASYWMGNIIGVVFISFVSDMFGRRICMAFGSLVCFAGVAICTATISQGAFVAGRILLGTGGVVVGAIGPVWMAELSYPSQRATATALSNTTYSAGSILAAWVTFGSFRLLSTWAWRTPTIIQALPSVAILIAAIVLPESPRWLASQDKPEKALAVLAKYHGNGDAQDPVVQFQFREICETIELEKVAKTTSWMTLVNTPGNRWRTFILIWCGIAKQWSGNGLVSYYLGSMLKSAGITGQTNTTLITATSSMFSFACSFAFAFLPARVGRRPLLLWSMGLMWLVFSLITITTGVFVETKNKSASYASVAFIYLYSGVHNLGWTGAMMVYVVEILPYSIRAKGMALFWLVTGMCGTFNTYVNPLGIKAFAWKFYFFYVVWIAIQFAIVYIFFPETKGPSLEQIALLFDGRNAHVSKSNPVAENILEAEGEKGFRDELQHVESVRPVEKGV